MLAHLRIPLALLFAFVVAPTPVPADAAELPNIPTPAQPTFEPPDPSFRGGFGGALEAWGERVAIGAYDKVYVYTRGEAQDVCGSCGSCQTSCGEGTCRTCDFSCDPSDAFCQTSLARCRTSRTECLAYVSNCVAEREACLPVLDACETQRDQCLADTGGTPEVLTSPTPLDDFERMSSLSANGDFLAVGVPYWSNSGAQGPNRTGSVLIYWWNGSAWTALHRLTPNGRVEPDVVPTGAGSRAFGLAVAFEGNTVLVNAGADAERGIPSPQVWAFTDEERDWDFRTLDTGDATPNQGIPGQKTLALDGRTLVLPATDATGSHYLVLDGVEQIWSESARLRPPAGSFGNEIALDGDLLAFGVEFGGTDFSGEAGVFRRTGGVWGPAQIFSAGQEVAREGASVDVLSASSRVHDADIVAVGAIQAFRPTQNDAGPGATHLYEYDGTTWVLRDSLYPVQEDCCSRMGTGVKLSRGDPTREFVLSYARDEASGIAGRAGTVYLHETRSAIETANELAYESQPLADSAFAFRALLYDDDNPEGEILAQIDGIDALYSRGRSRVAEDLLRRQIAQAPDPEEATAANLLLDLYYDRTAGEMIRANALVAEVEIARLTAPSPVIEAEIDAVQDVFDAYEFALVGDAAESYAGSYFGLLMDPLGTQGFPPLGFRLFRDLVPGRALESPLFDDGLPLADCDADGFRTALDFECTELVRGYKDLVLIFQLLRDYGRAARELAELRATNDEIAAARDLISRAQTLLYVHGDTWLDVFPGLDPQVGDAPNCGEPGAVPCVCDASSPTRGDPERCGGLAEAISGWRQAISELSTLAQVVDGNATVLGFEDDFLMIVQQTGGGADLPDSFNFLAEEWLDPSDASKPLGAAVEAWQRADASRGSFRMFQDTLAEQFRDVRGDYASRLREITGAQRGTALYDAPHLNPGSLIQQQLGSIDQAALGIRRNKVEIANLRGEIGIEVTRRNQERAVMNAMQQLVVDYGDEQATLTEVLGDIEAVQAGADAYESSVAALAMGNPGPVLAGALNGFVQVTAEQDKATLNAAKERLAAQERADLIALDSQILDFNSQAKIQTLLLQMNLLAVDSQEAVLLLKQEVARLKGLYNEQAELERAMDEANERLVGRYFADPTHRIRADRDLLQADFLFEEAQRWLYFMVRAFEYKWNSPFIIPRAGGLPDWTEESVFKLRNARELREMYLAMVPFAGPLDFTNAQPDLFSTFSVREHVFGYRARAGGQTLLYPNPADPDGPLVDAFTAFRERIRQSDILDVQNPNNPFDDLLRLRFSTVREIAVSSFFKGPSFLFEFDNQGNVISKTVDPNNKGLYLDKIRWLKVTLPGDHGPFAPARVDGTLTYAGTNYVRTLVGTGDGDGSSRLDGEFSAFPTRNFRFQIAPQFPQGRWISEASITDNPQFELTNQPPTDCTESVNLSTGFRERSVATSDWTLLVPAASLAEIDLGALDDIQIHFCHKAFGR